MRLERKKEIRSLIKTIPQLVKSGLVNQAFETEKVIASTFDFSEGFLEKLGGIPQNHIEAIQEIYSEMMNRGYGVGYKAGDIKSKSVTVDKTLPEDEFDRELEIRMPMNFGVKMDLIALFREEIAPYFETIPEKVEEISAQFEKDLLGIYKEGIKDYLTSMPNNEVEQVEHNEKEGIEEEEPVVEDVVEDVEVSTPEDFDATTVETDQELAIDLTAKVAANIWEKYATADLKELFKAQAEEESHRVNAEMVLEFSDWLSQGKKVSDYIPEETFKIVANTISKEVLHKLEEYCRLLGTGEAEKVLRFTLGLGGKSKKATASAKVDVEETGLVEESTYAKLEAYTKLLKNPTAEKVLRYYLGLSPKSATASFKSEARQVGPYDSQALRQKVKSLIRQHDYDEGNDFQTIVVECIVSDLEKMPEKEAVNAIASQLNLSVSDSESLEKVEAKADAMASSLNMSTGLPGYFMFLTLPGGDFCLTYNFDKPERAFMGVGIEPALASIPGGPQGVLTKSDQAQIQALINLGKSRTYKDIKKASPKLAVHLSRILNDIRMSKINLVDGTRKLRSNIEDLIGDVFGHDGRSYYVHLKTNL